MDERRGRRATVQTSLRTAAIWAAVHTVVDSRATQVGRALQVLDLGGGTGGMAVPLAALGHHVTVVDPSPDALAALLRRATEDGIAVTGSPDGSEAGWGAGEGTGDGAEGTGDGAEGTEDGETGSVRAVQGDADGLALLYPAGTADLVCCHGILELVDDPAATIAAVAAALAPGGTVSVVAAGRLGAVVARALAGRYAQAHEALTSLDGRYGEDDPMPRRFDLRQLADLVTAAGLRVVDSHGVRVFSDLVEAALPQLRDSHPVDRHPDRHAGDRHTGDRPAGDRHTGDRPAGDRHTGDRPAGDRQEPGDPLHGRHPHDREADRSALLRLEQEVARHPRYAHLADLGAALHVLADRPG